MKKLFTGRFCRIPIAVLTGVLLSILVAGGVVAAVGGFTLWQATSNVTVTEPVHIHYGPNATSCDTELGLNDPLGASVGLVPGVCLTTCFNITSTSPSPLLIKATVTSSDSSAVTVTFNVTGILTTGMNITSSSGPVYVLRTVCVNGAAAPGLYTVSTGFTRESSL